MLSLKWRRQNATTQVDCCAGSSCSCCVALGLGFFGFVWLVPDEEVVLDRNADGIVVLTGGASRIADAIELLAAGRGKRLLISGVNPGTTTRRYRASGRGLQPSSSTCCVDLDYSAINTLGNAVETRRWAIDRGFHSLIIVTSAYHMPRAIAEIAHQLPDVALIPFPGRRRPAARSSRGGRTARPRGWSCRNISNTCSPICACALTARPPRPPTTRRRRLPRLTAAPDNGFQSIRANLCRVPPYRCSSRVRCCSTAVLCQHHRPHDRGAADDLAAPMLHARRACAAMRGSTFGCCASFAASPSNGAGARRSPPGPASSPANTNRCGRLSRCSMLLPDPTYVLKRELMWLPLVRLARAKARMIPIDRGARAKALASMTAAARREAARGRADRDLSGRHAASAGRRAALHAGRRLSFTAELGLPCVPIALNSGLFWPRRSLRRYPGTVLVEVLDPIPPGLEKREFLMRCRTPPRKRPPGLSPKEEAARLTRNRQSEISYRICA